MTHKELIVPLSLMIAAALPLPAGTSGTPLAPAGSPDTRYCLRVDPVTGSRMETIQCWTRADWAAQGVDVDAEWAENGVRVLA